MWLGACGAWSPAGLPVGSPDERSTLQEFALTEAFRDFVG